MYYGSYGGVALEYIILVLEYDARMNYIKMKSMVDPDMAYMTIKAFGSKEINYYLKH